MVSPRNKSDSAAGDEKNLMIEKELCENSLHFLCTEVLHYKDWDICHDELDKFLSDSKKNYKLILMPREHLKTSIVTIAAQIQHILKNPNASILVVNASLTQSKAFLREIKHALMTNRILTNLYGYFPSEKWSETEIIIRQRTSGDKTPTISVGSPEHIIIGQHYDVVVLDDIVERSTVSTGEQIEKTRRFYSDVFDLLKKRTGKLFIVGTRWHEKDLYGEILESESSKPDSEKSFDIFVKKVKENGKFIFPSKFNDSVLQDLREKKGSYEFSCQYYNEVVDKESQHFKPPARYWSDLPKNAMHRITVDLAIGEGKDNDFTVVMDCIVTLYGQIFVCDYVRRKMNVLDTINEVFSAIYKVDQNCVVGVESIAYQQALYQLLEMEKRKRNCKVDITPIKYSKDKFTRIMALQPYWETKNLLLKQGMVELEDELFAFPSGRHDDCIDALAMQLQFTGVRDAQRQSRYKFYSPSRRAAENRGENYVLREALQI